MKDKKVYIFDLDGTLAESKSAITEDMANVLSNLLKTKKLAIISGGNFPQFESQVISKLVQDHNILKYIYLSSLGNSNVCI